ncbi:uncharacterized protein VTP21DRAFT_7383 [Calcarisporiella thermophila]|uniref:uncharacterized protein n=1 Tax=Calcarisporiella thermophila TaxID=911321 RepID=UPI0037444FC8
MSATIFDNFLRVRLDSSDVENEGVDFHFFWLRHNCPCFVGCRHPKSGERILSLSSVPLSIKPASVAFSPSNDELIITWNESDPNGNQHVSTYTLEWLKEHAYAATREKTALPADLNRVELDYRDFAKHGENLDGEALKKYRLECGLRLKIYGLVVVRNRGLDTEGIIRDFHPEGKDCIPSHFGRYEDLRTDNTTNQNTDQLGYTDAGVDLHTDQPYLEFPPGTQFLQCITPATHGGDSYLVDGFSAAHYLRTEISSRFFSILSTTPLNFQCKQSKYETVVARPAFEASPDSPLTLSRIRFSDFRLAPFNLPFNQMEEWYQAYNTFVKVVKNEKHQYRFSLKTGDIVLYDNWRMLHARTSFSGPRHVRGVYLDRSAVFSTTIGDIAV